jgi:hypothetical protein
LQAAWQTAVTADAVVLAVASVVVVTADVAIVAGAGAVVAGRRRRRSGCHAPSWAAWCSR